MSGFFSQKHTHRFYLAALFILTLWMALPGISKVQVIDRDEARFAQATVQMVESGDYLKINFQDKARNKKPAGIYWLQAASVKAFTDPGERKIWTHRIISTLGALLAVFATYWGALAVLGRRGAFVAGAILATSLVFVAEAHIAKTDAVLCGLSALTLACLLRLQKQDNRLTAFIFWVAMGCAVMIKGPITPLIILLAVIAYSVWNKGARWLKPLINIPGIIIAMLIVIPWAVAIGIATDGAFFSDSLVGDMGSKVASGQESHGAPPGTYLATLFLGFWPGILLLVPGLAFAKIIASLQSGDLALRNAVRLLICWIVPFWLILEITPTKLIHYPLPLYPAFAILCAGALFAMMETGAFRKTRRVSAVLFLFAALALITAIFGGDALLSDRPSVFLFSFPLFVALAFAATISMWMGDIRTALISALALTLTLTPITYQFILPNLTQLRLSDRIASAMQASNLKPARVMSPGFTEPSLVYKIGTGILLGDKADRAINSGLKTGDLLLIDRELEAEQYSILILRTKLEDKNNCLIEKDKITGTNISRGDPVDIRIYKIEMCGG